MPSTSALPSSQYSQDCELPRVYGAAQTSSGSSARPRHNAPRLSQRSAGPG